MSKKLFAMFMAMGLLISMVGGVSASDHLFPAQNEDACDDAGGVFTQVGSLRTCVVDDVEYGETDEVVRKWAGKSGRSWSQDETTTTQTVTTYTRDGSTLIAGDPVVVGSETVYGDCYNPGGNVVDPSESDHCLSN